MEHLSAPIRAAAAPSSSSSSSHFSLAPDGSADVRDSAPLLIFICGTNDSSKGTEELAPLKSIQGTAPGEGIYEEVCQTMNALELDRDKLFSVTSDGAASMAAVREGVVAALTER